VKEETIINKLTELWKEILDYKYG